MQFYHFEAISDHYFNNFNKEPENRFPGNCQRAYGAALLSAENQEG